MTARDQINAVPPLAAVAALTLALLAVGDPAHAATMSASLTAPVIDAVDIASYGPQTRLDKWWAEDNTGAGSAKGQTFTTGSDDVLLNAITYQIASTQKAEPEKVYVIRVGAVSGTTFSEIYSETATQTFTWNSSEYMTWTLDSPVALSAHSVYGIDIGMISSTTGWRTGIPYLQYGENDYAGGDRYTTGQFGVGTDVLVLDTGHRDRIFHLDLTETYDTLTWDGLGDGNWGTAHWLDKDGNGVGWFPDVADPANAEINANTVTVAENRQVVGLTVGGSGGVAVADSKALTVLRTANFAEGTSLGLGAGAGFSAGRGSIASVALAGNATVTVGEGVLDVASLTSAGGTLTKLGAGTLWARAVTADPAAAFQVGEGTFDVGGARPLGDSTTLVLSGGTFRVTGGETTLPGLTVGTLVGNINTGDENPGNLGVDPLGPTIANGHVGSGNTTWVFTGMVQDINGDGVLSFYENIDDKTRLTVEGTADVLNNDSWNTPTGGTVAVTPGAWVPFELRFSNGSGPGGAESDPGFGFGWSDVDTSADPANKDLYSFAFNDPGVTELFRTLAPGPIDMTGVALTVTSDSTIDVVTEASAAFAAPTVEAGILTTTSPTNAPVTFQGVNIDPAATRVGFDPQTPTTYGTIANNSTQAKLTVVKAGPSTWSLDAAPAGATGTGNVTWEVQDGTLEVAGSEPLGDRPVVMAGGTLRIVSPIVVPIDNAGFEDPVLADDDWNWSMDDQGWGYYDNDGYQGSWNAVTDNYPAEAPEGENVGWTNPGGVGVPGGFAQVLTDADATLKAGMTYTLTVEVGNALGYDWAGYTVQLLAGGTPHTPGTGGGYTGPVTGGTLLAEDSNSLTVAAGTFETSTVTYVYDPADSGLLGQPLQVRLLALGVTGEEEIDFDDVRLTEVVTGTSPGPMDLDGIDVTVTGDSTLEVVDQYDAALKSLTLHDGTTLTTAGAPTSFTGTTIVGANVGITARTDTTLTRVVGLDAGVHDATIAVKGPARVILDKPAVGLDSGDTFSLQAGGTLGLLLQDAGSPAGGAAFEFAGGSVLLSSAAGDVDPANRTWDAPMTVSGPGKIAAGQLPGGVAAATMTIGGANALTLSGLATLSLEARAGHTLDIAGDIVGDGGIEAAGGTVNVSSGAATYTGSTVVSGGEVNLNTPALNTASVEVTGGVLNLNADLTTNGGAAAGSVDYTFYDGESGVANLSGIDNGIDDDATNGGFFDLDPTSSVHSTETMNRPYGGKGDLYGDMWSGVFIAPESGEYTFRVHGDDNEVLFIDLDRDGDFEVSNNEKITDNITNHWNTPTTGSATLVAGRVYGFALAHTEATGGDWVEFQMQMPGESSLGWVDFGDGKWGSAVSSRTTVDAGVLNVADGVTLTTGEVIVSGGGALDVKPTGTLATTKVTMDSGALTVPHGLNLTELDYSGGVLNLGGDLAVSERLTAGGPLDLTGKTLTTTAGVTKVDVLAGGALTVSDPIGGSDLTVAGSLLAPAVAFDSVAVPGGSLSTAGGQIATSLDVSGTGSAEVGGVAVAEVKVDAAGSVTAATAMTVSDKIVMGGSKTIGVSAGHTFGAAGTFSDSDDDSRTLTLDSEGSAVTIGIPAGGTAGLSYIPITNDADSEIDSAKTYTHAIDFGSRAPATVNGVAFVQDFGTASGAITNEGSTSIPSPHGGNTAHNVTGDVVELFYDMNYNNATAEVVLTGLAEGQWYDFRLYNRAWGVADRSQDFEYYIGDATVAADSVNLNEDDASADPPALDVWNRAYAMSYVYQADAAGKITVKINQTGDGTYHNYGLTNELTVGGPETSLSLPNTDIAVTADSTLHLLGADDVDLGNLSVDAGVTATVASGSAVSFRDVTGGGVVDSFLFLARGQIRPGDGIGSLTVNGFVAIEAGGALAPDVQGSDTADVLVVSSSLILSEAADAIAPSWVPGADAGSKFGGRYLVARTDTETVGVFDVRGGGNIGADYIADVEYNVDMGDDTKGVYLTLHSLIDADTNLDGAVDYDDYAAARDAFAAGGPADWFGGDSDLDGDLDAADYLILKQQFGSSFTGEAVAGDTAAPVPEPATLSLLALGGLALIRRRRK